LAQTEYYAYDAAANLANAKNAAGAYTYFAYDVNNRQTQISTML